MQIYFLLFTHAVLTCAAHSNITCHTICFPIETLFKTTTITHDPVTTIQTIFPTITVTIHQTMSHTFSTTDVLVETLTEQSSSILPTETELENDPFGFFPVVPEDSTTVEEESHSSSTPTPYLPQGTCSEPEASQSQSV